MPDITIGRLRGGFCVTWTGDDGKRRRHQLAARTRAAAEPEAIDIYRRETYRPGAHTVADIWEAYRADLGDKPTATTMKSTGKAVLAHFGAYRADQIDKPLCLSYAAARAAAGIKQGSVHTELGHLRSALKFAADTRMVDRAPRIWSPPKPAPKERYLTHEEIARLLDAASAPHIEVALHLLLSTAARVGAVLDLTWDRVDLDRGQINYRLDDAITRKGRAVVPINASLRAVLAQAREAALSDHVVEYASKQVKSIRKGFANACDRAKLAEVTIHTLRHTGGVHMAAAGIPMWKISQMMGHSNTATTERVYARFAPEHMQDAADVLDFVKIRGMK